MKDVLSQIFVLENLEVLSYAVLKSTAEATVYKLHTASENFILKLTLAQSTPKSYEREGFGLNYLKKRSKFIIPNVRSVGEYKFYQYLIITFLQTRSEGADFWDHFGSNLAHLHRNSHSQFGFWHSNYIGGLLQFNNFTDTAADFYIEQRLIPQFALAYNNGYKFKDLDVFYRNVNDLIPNEAPALLHGDLWSGNYLSVEEGSPALIDPALSYAHRESDLAMMRLFGGFSERVFEVYQSCFPLADEWKSRIALFQLYYILVHLNLFGSSYYSKTELLIDQYR